MGAKEELLRLKRKLDLSYYRPTILDTKVDDFIYWYYQNMIKGYYTDIGKYYISKNMRNFIEKMAIWYELRYSEDQIDQVLYCSSQELMKINSSIFKNSQSINNQLDKIFDPIGVDWNKFYESQAFTEFFKLLSAKEQTLFLIPKTIKESLSSSDEITIWEYQKEEMLNCVMYRIIERGGNRIGPRRAFLFAKEFKRDIDVPMIYGVDLADSHLISFIDAYLQAGGVEDLVCYNQYLSNGYQKEEIDTITIREILSIDNNKTPQGNKDKIKGLGKNKHNQ